MILALPSETSQERGSRLLREWQEQRKQGLKPDQRTLPDDQFNRDLEIIRQVMSRT
jgi:hypothetical protein